jgi:hypothetical protein
MIEEEDWWIRRGILKRRIKIKMKMKMMKS